MNAREALSGEKEMIEKINTLIREKDTCVLSTVSGNSNPHCSLMAYATDDECREIYMITPRLSRKYRNLLNNPVVSLLIDSRGPEPLQGVQALTVRGVSEPFPDDIKKADAADRLLGRHPYLKDFIKDPENEFIRIKIQSHLLLNGLTKSHYIDLEKKEISIER